MEHLVSEHPYGSQIDLTLPVGQEVDRIRDLKLVSRRLQTIRRLEKVQSAHEAGIIKVGV